MDISKEMIDTYKIACLSMTPSEMYLDMLDIDFLIVSKELRELVQKTPAMRELKTDIIGKGISDGQIVYLTYTSGPPIMIEAESRLEQLLSEVMCQMSDDADGEEMDIYESY